MREPVCGEKQETEWGSMREQAKKMTIKDIAQLADTSYSTVSRILNKPNYKCSSSELEEKVRRLARELNYVPDASARSLQGKGNEDTKIWNIHILHTRIGGNEADPFYAEIMRYLFARLYQGNTLLSNIWYMPELRYDHVSQLSEIKSAEERLFAESEGKADGIIILGQCNRDVLKNLKKRFKAVVMVVRNGLQYDVDQIITEGGRSTSKAVEYFVSQGHQKIGYAGPCQMDENFENYGKVLDKYGMELRRDFIFDCQRTEEAGVKAIQHFLAQEDKPTAIYFSNDIIAVGALRYLSQNRIVSYQPSIIASDGIEQGEYTKPMLSTVNVNKEEIAALAIDTLTGRLRGRHTSQLVMQLEGDLLIRESSRKEESEMYYCEYYI
jgi:DNA-binding LacI/PurR family transcriptional regulator